jgi:hypothetical protein
MANLAAFESGWQLGSQRAEDRRLRQQQLQDEERRTKVLDLYGKRDALSKLIPSLAAGSDEYTKAMSGLTDIETQIAGIYHPVNGPGLLQKDWNFLKGLISGKTKATPAVLSKTVEPGTPEAALTMPSGPVVTFPGTKQTITRPAAGGIGPEQSFTVETPSSAVAAPAESVTLGATPKTATAVTAGQARMTPQQRKLWARQQEAKRRAEQDVLTAGLSPQQEAQQESAKNLATITQAVKDYKTMKPDATPEEQAQFFNDVVSKTYGFTQTKPVWKEYLSPDGTKQWFDASRPDLIPPGWNATGTETADTRTRADFAKYKLQHPEYSGSYLQWKAEQTQLAKLTVPTQRDDRFIDIERRRALGQPLTADDQAYSAAYDLYINKRIINPMLARAAAQGADRYVSVLDPANPEKVIFMPAGQAARAGAGTPASIGFQTDKGITKYMTSGKGAENITAFNTAVSHLKLLGEAGEALDNGDVERLNQLKNAFTREFGGAAPTNFAAVKTAVAGEVAKVFTGRGATVEEIAQINGVINAAESPDQIRGAIRYYTDLMQGKLDAQRAQFTAGKAGLPAFPENVPPAPKGGTPKAGAPGAPSGSKGGRSIGQAMKYWQQKGQPKTEPWVIQDLQKHGYIPVRP